MASNFAFVPVGITANITAGSATLTTTLTASGPAITTGNFTPDGVRIANSGTAVVFVQFGVTAPTVAAGTGMPIFGNTVETFQLKGQRAMAYFCQSTFTTTLFMTPGEGL